MLQTVIDFLAGYFGEPLWGNILTAFRFVAYSLYVFLPLVFSVALLKIWIKYIRMRFIHKEGSILLEVKIPKEMNKSPAAMEVFLSHLHSVSRPSYLEAFLEGKIRPWFSLEIVSVEGNVSFFVWCSVKLRGLIEAQLYAQFPNIEVHEVPDYAAQVPFNPIKYQYMGVQWKLTKADAYPIKTYIDYGLDKDPKEEFKIDPITSTLEYLGALKKGEQAWIQILIRGHRDEDLKDLVLFPKSDWKPGVKEQIKKIAKESLLGEPTDKEAGTVLKLTRGQQDTIAALERSLNKFPFDSMIRGFYIAKNEVFNSANIGGLIGTFKQYGSGELNGFKPGFSTKVDYPWQDIRGKRVVKWKKQLFDAYKRRSFFYPPYRNFKSKSYVLTTEEIATMWHFPGGVAGTPTFNRVTSRKGEAPGNLPI